MSQVLDLEKFKKDSLTIKLGGKEFVINKIPFDISLELYDLIPVFQNMESEKKIKKEDYIKMLNVFYEIFKLSDSALEYEWLRKEIDQDVFSEISVPIFLKVFQDSKKNKEKEDDLPRSTLDG